MKKLLLVVDMQKDFIFGPLGTEAAQGILPGVMEKIKDHVASGGEVIFTKDTHGEDYLNTNEGQHLPVPHCIKGTRGWMFPDELETLAKDIGATVLEKNTFGSLSCAQHIKSLNCDEVEIIGLCTDICVVSNALILKAVAPELPIFVDENCCAGVTWESHLAAMKTMEMCQVTVRPSQSRSQP